MSAGDALNVMLGRSDAHARHKTHSIFSLGASSGVIRNRHRALSSIAMRAAARAMDITHLFIAIAHRERKSMLIIIHQT